MSTTRRSRIRFGILMARFRFAPTRLTPSQWEFLDECWANGWMLGDRHTIDANDREYVNLLQLPRS